MSGAITYQEKHLRTRIYKCDCRPERSETSLIYLRSRSIQNWSEIPRSAQKDIISDVFSQSSPCSAFPRRAPIHKPHASVRRFVARKILLRPECVHVVPIAARSSSLISTSCFRPAAISSGLVPIRSAALAAKPSGKLHSGVIRYGFCIRPCFEHGHWQTFTQRRQDECVACAIAFAFFRAELRTEENDRSAICNTA